MRLLSPHESRYRAALARWIASLAIEHDVESPSAVPRTVEEMDEDAELFVHLAQVVTDARDQLAADREYDMLADKIDQADNLRELLEGK